MGPRQGRRAFLSVAAAAVTAGCVTGIAREERTVEAPPVDVPGYHGGGGRTGTTGSPGPEGLIARKWTTAVRGETTAPPAVVDGVAYLADEEGVVTAIDARDGSRRWAVDAGGEHGLGGAGTPTVADGTVHATTGSSLVALDAEGGAERWRVDELAEGSPAVTDDRVYFGTGHALYAATRDGDVRWWYDEGEDLLESPSLHATPTAASGLVHVGVEDREPLTNRTVYAFEPGHAGPAWTRRTGYGRHTTAVVADGTVYYGADDHETDGHGAVLALEADSGEVRWTRRLPGGAVSTPTVADGTVYVGTERGVVALDAGDGTVGWRFARDRSEADRYELSDTAFVEAGSPVVAANALYVRARVETGSFLYALSPATGEPLWRRAGGYGEPVPVGGVAYATRAADAILGPDSLLTALGEYRRRER